MFQFIWRRLLLLFPVLIGILIITFALLRLIPGDPCYVILGERATPAKCKEFNERFGLNDNIAVQFIRYASNIVRGEFGDSIRESRPVVDILVERLPFTMELTLGAMIFSTIAGIFLGIISAVRRNTIVDVVTMIGANIGVSMPVFWLGLMLMYVFALQLRGTPFFIPPSGRLTPGTSITPLEEVWKLDQLTGFSKFFIGLLSHSAIFTTLVTANWEAFRDAVWHLILPSVAVGTIPLSIIARMTRSSMLEVLGLDYIRTARAKGLPFNSVVWKHAFRNALIPIVTVIGLQIGTLLSGAVLTETIFSLPGVGTQLVNAILARDYPVVQAFTVVIAIIFVTINLITDFSYAYLDPRIRVQ